jgi:ABC-type phosphate transport system substrate-binding protein
MSNPGGIFGHSASNATSNSKSQRGSVLLVYISSLGGLVIVAAAVYFATASIAHFPPFASHHTTGASSPPLRPTVTSSVPTSSPSGSRPSGSPGCVKGTLEIYGSTAFGPIAHDAAVAYMHNCQGVTIVVNGGDSAYGLTQARNAESSNSPTIGMYDGEPDKSETGGLAPYPIGVLIFSVVAHNNLIPSLNLTTDELRTIFTQPGEQGKVAVGRLAGSGSRLTFITKVLHLDPSAQDIQPDKGGCPSPTPGSTASFKNCTEDSTDHLLTYVNETLNAIGYAEAYELAGYSQVSMIEINNVAPSTTNVLNKSYKYWIVEHLYTATRPTALAKSFLDFLPTYLKSNDQTEFIACSHVPKSLGTDC